VRRIPRAGSLDFLQYQVILRLTKNGADMGGGKALQRGARVEAVAYSAIVRIAVVSIPDALVQTSAASEAQAMRLAGSSKTSTGTS
jgi:hypothetical protein